MAAARVLLPALAAVASLVVGAGPAAAASDLVIHKVDTSRLPAVRLVVTVPAGASVAPFRVSENGRPVPAGALTVQRPSGRTAVSLVIDTSHTMRGRPLRAALDAAGDYLARKAPDDEVALFTVGPTVQTVQPLTSDLTALRTSLRGVDIAAAPGTALNDAIAAGIRELASTPDTTRRVLIVLADGEDNASRTTVDALDALAVRDGVTVYAIAIKSRAYDVDALEGIAGRTGGSTFEASTADLRDAYRSIAEELSRSFVLLYRSTTAAGVALTVSRGDASAASSYIGPPPGRVSEGEGPIPAWITHASWSAPALSLLTLALLLTALLLIFSPRPRRTLAQRLLPYAQTSTVEERDEAAPSVSFTRHVAYATERALGELKFWKGMARVIERSDLKLRTAELFYLTVGAGLIVGLLATLLGLPLLLRVPPVVLGAALPLLFVSRRAKKRQAAFDDQLADTLMTMASSMKAGHSFNQAMEVVITEGADPIAGEFARAATEVRLGQAADAALDRMARRLDSANFGFVVTAVNIQRQVGGSLAEILDSVADTVRARQQFLRKVKALTAMGRASAYVLVAMPFLLAGLLTLLNPSFIMPLFTTLPGQLMLGMALMSIAMGSLILKKLVSFKV